MPAPIQLREFYRNLQPRERHFRLPEIALRRRAAEHPMVMFAVIVSIAFLSMALIPTSGPAFASLDAHARLTEGDHSTSKTSRLPISETDLACRGQAWGAETEACLTVIASESGWDQSQKLRLIAGAAALTHTPNIF
ncbi:MAG: hypothetical protein H0T56_01845 [Pseudaminobacter sp.]|nr:hypothetical protein [Pseudaminobacter sp.]